MNLNKENLKKIRGLIVFTVILLIALWNYSLILDVLGQGVGIVYPFLLGGAIAFVINVPMSFFEEKLFQNQMMKNKKVAQRLARPISLIITLIVVVSVIGLVILKKKTNAEKRLLRSVLCLSASHSHNLHGSHFPVV